MSGVTDALLGGAAAAVRGERVRLRELTETLRATASRRGSASSSSPRASGQVVLDPIDQHLAEFAMLCDALAVLGEASPRALDAVSSLGERMSVHLLAGALRRLGTPAAAGRRRRDRPHRRRVPGGGARHGRDAPPHAARCWSRCSPRASCRSSPASSARSPDGVVTTLGRGGSDYSAAILGAAMDADEVWIYTDVDGVMTADPRVVPDVRTLDTLSYREMSELAYFGAKVLHPKTVLPALERGIPIRIRNTFNPAHLGTLVVGKSDDPVAVFKGVTAIRHQSLVTIEGRGMLGVPGIAARAFGSVARTGTSVSMISQASSEQSICFLVPQVASATVVDTLRPRVRARARAARHREHLDASTRRSSSRSWARRSSRRRASRAASSARSALAGINVIAIAMGSSECSISLVVEATDAEQAVKCLHTLI